MTCARCQAEIPAGARFCAACGAPSARPCPQCATPVFVGQRFCTGCGADVAPTAAAPALGTGGGGEDGERRQATVMFSDLSGYTALNEAFDPEEVEALMARDQGGCQRRHRAPRRHGEPVRRRRDHGPVRHPGRAPRRCAPRRRGGARAARRRRRLPGDAGAGLRAKPGDAHRHRHRPRRRPAQRRARRRLRAHRRRGEHGGPPAQRRRPREVVVSATTWQQVADAFDAEATAPMALKGKDQPLVAYRIRGARKAPAGDATPLVGRDEELRDFRALAEACAQRRRSRVVIVRGDPGVGKSRLVAEFVATARDARLLVPRRAGPRLRRRDRSRCRAQPRAQPARRRRQCRRGRATRGDRARERGAADGRRAATSSSTTCSTSRRRPSCARSLRR